MRLLIDTNLVLDVLLARQSWVVESAAVWRAVDAGQVAGFLAATTLTNIFYIVRRAAGLPIAFASVRTCVETFEICEVNRQSLAEALAMAGNDFEDHVQTACAMAARLDGIVTRDLGGFAAAPIAVLSPADLLVRLTEQP